MSLQEDELPVLNDIVESGNPSIIQSTRMGNEVLRELETLRQDAVRRFPNTANQDAQDTHTAPDDTSESAKLRPDVLASQDTPEANVNVVPPVEIPQGLDFASLATDASHKSENTSVVLNFCDDEIELLIDDVVDRHITALRQDIKQLLERARSKP